MMRNKLPQALPCLQITGLAAQVAEKYGLRPVPYSALRRVYDTRFPLPMQTRSPNGQMWVDRYYIAWQLGSGPVRYGYLTRRHIFEELTAYRAAARLRGTPVLLPADIGAAFSSALRQMRLQPLLVLRRVFAVEMSAQKWKIIVTVHGPDLLSAD